jgi:GxxExxY protein
VTNVEVSTCQPINDELDRLAAIVVEAGFKVHRSLGPGLLESACERCIAYELGEQGFKVRRQVPVRSIIEG